MANQDAAFGLKAIGKVGQNRDNQGLSEYGIAASSTAIYQNDPIMMAATGKIVVGTAAAANHSSHPASRELPSRHPVSAHFNCLTFCVSSH